MLPMAPATGKHPFFNGCEEIPQDLIPGVQKIQSWINTQPNLPKITDDHVYMFLHSNYYDLESTKKTIASFYAVRLSATDLFMNQSPQNPDIQSVFRMLYMVPLPKTTPEGCKVIILKLSDPDPEKFVHVNTAKAVILFNDVRLAEDGITPGYIFVCDARGFSLSHLTRINLHVLRVYMKYMQEARPIRLKGLHVIYSAKIVDKLVALAKPFMKAELQKLLKIHTGEDLSNFFKYVPQEIMPEDYGGKAESLKVLHERNKRLVETKYPKWVEEEELAMKEVIKIRSLKKKYSFTTSEPVDGFRNLAID